MYRHADDEAAKRDREAEAAELDAFGRRVKAPRSIKRVALTVVLVVSGLVFVAGVVLLVALWQIADAFPHGDQECMPLPDGGFRPDVQCVHGHRLPKVPATPSASADRRE